MFRRAIAVAAFYLLTVTASAAPARLVLQGLTELVPAAPPGQTETVTIAVSAEGLSDIAALGYDLKPIESITFHRVNVAGGITAVFPVSGEPLDFTQGTITLTQGPNTTLKKVGAPSGILTVTVDPPAFEGGATCCSPPLRPGW